MGVVVGRRGIIRATPRSLSVFKLTDIIPQGAIITALKATDREGVIRELVASVARAGGVPAPLESELAQRVLDRERKTSTGFGCGVAVPHAKHPRITTMCAAIGIAPRGVDFSALDRQPVYSVFLIVSPQDKPEEHLRAMEVIFKNLSKETFRRALRQAATEQDVRDLIAAADAHQLQT
jgi:mannitol/fructose-specific phosphotransferase system IIA component (Ntr-type)